MLLNIFFVEKIYNSGNGIIRTKMISCIFHKGCMMHSIYQKSNSGLLSIDLPTFSEQTNIAEMSPHQKINKALVEG